jgi:hypothetical protein
MTATSGVHTVYLEFGSGTSVPFVSLHYFRFTAG